MKESGINYFYNALGLNTGQFTVFYTYENGAGTSVSSVSGGQSVYSGTLSSSSTFWSKPGSGFYSGTTLSVANASGTHSEAWTKVFVYEQTQTGGFTLFDSLGGSSGYRIGVTDANRLYFESYNVEPILAASLTNLSSKNAVAIGYATNYVTFDYFNVNAQAIESESFSLPFQVAQSDAWTLGGGAPYYADYFINLTALQSPQVVGQLLSGLYARPTGYGSIITTTCISSVTGYQNVIVGETGITGYIITVGGDEGRDYYTGAFPTSHTATALTGYLSSGLYASGVTGLVCNDVTGAPTALLEYQTSYASSCGMQKVQTFYFVPTGNITKASWSHIPFDDIYNRQGVRNFSGYFTPTYPTGLMNLYWNGVAQANSGWYFTGSYLIISGATAVDLAFYDLKTGDKRSYPVAGGAATFVFSYSGQEIYLNGIDLISGYDYTVTGSLLSLTARNTGVIGQIFECPIVLPSQTGQMTLVTGAPFGRNTANVYLNGVRQPNYVTYIEGGQFDLLSGNFFNSYYIASLYGNDDFFWE